MSDDLLRPARRVLHVCYCCTDLDAVSTFFVDAFAMRRTMGTPSTKADGAILGIDGDVISPTHFVYDARGPRTSPAIEVQGWVDPPLTGTPIDDLTRVGMHALGFAVADLDATTTTLVASGCAVRGSGQSPFDGSQWVSVRDPTGVTIDIVEDAAVPDGESRMHHLRVTCRDLDASRRWYEGIGFEAVGATTITDAGFLDSSLDGLFDGARGSVSAEALRMRLPDEPFEVKLVEWRTPPSHDRAVAEANHAGLYRAALAVDDTRASYAAMTEAGWEFTRAPMSIELKGTPVPDMWIAFLHDPDGVPYELVERPRSAFR